MGFYTATPFLKQAKFQVQVRYIIRHSTVHNAAGFVLDLKHWVCYLGGMPRPATPNARFVSNHKNGPVAVVVPGICERPRVLTGRPAHFITSK